MLILQTDQRSLILLDMHIILYFVICVNIFDCNVLPGLDMSLHKEQAYPVTNICIENGNKSKWSIIVKKIYYCFV